MGQLHNEVVTNFAGMELEDYQAGSGPDVNIIGRWHDSLTLTGVVISEAETTQALVKWFFPWPSVCDIEILPALTDEEAHALAREMIAEG